MSSDPAIVVFGATGYTGGLVAEALLRRTIEPVLAARSREKLTEMSNRLGGLDIRTADVNRPETVEALVRKGDVLISTVGPFGRWGWPALDAAVSNGAHYIDSCGEGPFITATTLPPVRRTARSFPRSAMTTSLGISPGRSRRAALEAPRGRWTSRTSQRDPCAAGSAVGHAPRCRQACMNPPMCGAAVG
jgi:saccharopine dehydrogenase-like NADP-dependent oxidoreductase